MLKMIGNFNNKKESKPLSHKALKVSGGGYKPYKINDLAECADAQFSASLERAKDSAVIIADFEECKAECMACVQSPHVMLNLFQHLHRCDEKTNILSQEGNNNKINYNIHRASGRVSAL